MVFNRKDVFRHDFGSEGAQPASIAIKSAPVKAAAAKTVATKPGESEQPQALKAAWAAQQANPPASGANPLTTAEAIAAELRAAQDALPAPSNATFAPDSLNPANAVPTARRRAGANLAGFKTIAKGLFRN